MYFLGRCKYYKIAILYHLHIIAITAKCQIYINMAKIIFLSKTRAAQQKAADFEPKNIPLAARSRLEALAVFCCGLGVHFLIFSRARSL
jgi:hypothetical protein